MARASMANLITRVRGLIYDPAGASQIFSDDDIQNVMDAGPRLEARFLRLKPSPTYVSGVYSYLDYYAENLTDWEEDATFWQYLNTQVTPSTSEYITGHWKFTASTPPSVFIVGKTYDLYRAAADLLERRSAKWALDFDVVVGGQTFRQSQVSDQLGKLAKSYRAKQRIGSITMTRSDLVIGEYSTDLGPRPIDYRA